jgi:hypothetical protein
VTDGFQPRDIAVTGRERTAPPGSRKDVTP